VTTKTAKLTKFHKFNVFYEDL